MMTPAGFTPAPAAAAEIFANLNLVLALPGEARRSFLATLTVSQLKATFLKGWSELWTVDYPQREPLFVAMQAIRDQMRARVVTANGYGEHKVREAIVYEMDRKLTAAFSAEAGGPMNLTAAQALDVAVYLLGVIADGGGVEGLEFFEMKAAIGEARTNAWEAPVMEAVARKAEGSAQSAR